MDAHHDVMKAGQSLHVEFASWPALAPARQAASLRCYAWCAIQALFFIHASSTVDSEPDVPYSCLIHAMIVLCEPQEGLLETLGCCVGCTGD